jgi:hypothetical protein
LVVRVDYQEVVKLAQIDTPSLLCKPSWPRHSRYIFSRPGNLLPSPKATRSCKFM